MIETIMHSLYKVLNMIFDIDESALEQFYQKIETDIKDKKKLASIESIKKQINDILFQLITTFSLNLITQFAGIAVSKNSIDIIKELNDYDNKNKIDFNIVLFKMICFERYGNEEIFSIYLDSIYDKLTNSAQTYLIKRIFSLFVITTNISNKSIDKICTKINVQKSAILGLPLKHKQLIQSH